MVRSTATTCEMGRMRRDEARRGWRRKFAKSKCIGGQRAKRQRLRLRSQRQPSEREQVDDSLTRTREIADCSRVVCTDCTPCATVEYTLLDLPIAAEVRVRTN